MRILLIEDDPVVAESIELMLTAETFHVCTTALGAQGIELGKLADSDFIVLDLTLPDISGYDVLRELRRANVQTPILILSGLADIESKVKGFGFGADDYLTKPFHKDELAARIHTIMRRATRASEPLLRCGDLVIRQHLKRAEIASEPVRLTTKEFQLLELLALRQGSALTKEMILNQLYGGMDQPELKIIDVFICKLRKKLAQASSGKDYIETVRGLGYMLRDTEGLRVAA